jgi:protein-disulfide isomerase
VNRFLANASTGALLLSALTVSGLALRRELAPPAAASVPPAPTRTVEDWASHVLGRRLGPADAPLAVVVFSDYECPYCRTAAAHLESLRARHPGRLAVVYRHLPLSHHAGALPAATAAECAADQGRFPAYHAALFSHQDTLAAVRWTSLAADVGVPDTAAFARCIAVPGVRAEIARDVAAARALGIDGTPAVMVRGTLVTSGSPDVLDDLVGRALRPVLRP